MQTQIVIFPFDTFGSPGTGKGAQLVGDAVREMLDDNAMEDRPVRGLAYQEHVTVEEFEFAGMDDLAGWRGLGGRLAREAMDSGDFLVWVAGNHLGVLPVLEALAGTDTAVLQFDAHLDCYDLADCETGLSHGNYLLHMENRPEIVQVGHRDLFLTPEHIEGQFKAAFPAESCTTRVGDILAALGDTTKVWLDIDCDVFDPAFFPGVSQPLPFGLSPREVLALIAAVGNDRVAGVSIAEFDPSRDVRDISLETVMWLLERLLLMNYHG